MSLTVQSNGECSRVEKNRVQTGWRIVLKVICESKKLVVKPAVLSGLETKRQETVRERERDIDGLDMCRRGMGGILGEEC